MTYTLEESYGAKCVVAGAGFLLNNEMGDFNLVPDRTDTRGWIGTPPNRIEPRKRMLSSQTPTLVLKDRRVRVVTARPVDGLSPTRRCGSYSTSSNSGWTRATPSMPRAPITSGSPTC